MNPGNNFLRSIDLKFLNSAKRTWSKFTSIFSQIAKSSLDGDPNTLKIEKSWSPSVFPWKIGSKVISSASMHPTALFFYFWDKKIIKYPKYRLKSYSLSCIKLVLVLCSILRLCMEYFWLLCSTLWSFRNRKFWQYPLYWWEHFP